VSAPATEAGPVISGLEKRYLELSTGAEAGAWRFQPRPLTVVAIYELRRDQIATSVPIRRVTCPDDLGALPAVCQAIADDPPGAGED
jgi:hypothetical protein